MDNASLHGTNGTNEMCADVGVRLIKLPPYSSDLNPIEEFFSKLKTYVWKDMGHRICAYRRVAFLRLLMMGLWRKQMV